jgi:hypothetical protein
VSKCCCRYEILGTTLTASSLPSTEMLDIYLEDLEEQVNSCLSCPPLLLQVIRDVSHCSRPPNPECLPAMGNDRLLSIVDAFSPDAWAKSLQQVSSSFDLELRTHIGCAYKAAVKIYILRATVITNPHSTTLNSLEDLVSEVILHLKCVPPNDSFFKATFWPLFMAGGESNNPDHRAWVFSRFETALQILPWGYLSSALDLLNRVWAQKGLREAGADWLINLKLSENDWLIA